MQLKTWIPLLALAVLVGCAKKDAEVAELPPDAAAQVEAQVEAQVIPPPTAQPAAPVQQRLVGAVHPQMTEKLLEFERTFKRMPEDFYEFSGRMMDSVPSAPPGMRYDIDPADKAVKLVMKPQ